MACTLKAWIEEYSNGEKILGVVLGEKPWEDEPNPNSTPFGKVLTWEEALPYIQYTFNDGFGCPDCHAITAWTENWVISVSQYDGSTRPFRIPRNPVDHTPSMPGG